MRHEFSKATKREALARSGGLCEAVGKVYGLPAGLRCNAVLATKGKEYDHYPLPAGDQDSDGVENCVVCCPTCHRRKTSHYDIPGLAKGKRVSDKHNGINVKKGWSKPKYEPRQARDIWADTPVEAIPERAKQ